LIRRGGIRYIRGANAPLKHPVRLKYLSERGILKRGASPLLDSPPVFFFLKKEREENYKRGHQPPLSITSPSPC
jgi:hypothetical protein